MVIVVVDLFLATYGFNTKLDNDRIFPTTPILNSILSDSEDFRVAVFSKTPGYRSNVLTYYGIPTVEGYATTAPRTYLQFVRTLFDDEKVYLNGLLELGKPNLHALRLLNVKYLITDFQMEGANLALQEHSNGHYLYRMTNHLPRVYCASDIVDYEDETRVLLNLRDLMGAHDRPIGVAAGIVSAQKLSGCAIKQIEVMLNGVIFTVDSRYGAVVSVPYNYSENWRGTVDGEPLDLVRANYSFLAVEVPAGEYRIEIRNTDWRLVLAAAIQILFGLGLLIFAFFYRKGPIGIRVGYAVIALAFILVNAASIPGISRDLAEKVIAQITHEQGL
jgi:uncharacterized membrane protein YfhO